jgi:hypothetical protein
VQWANIGDWSGGGREKTAALHSNDSRLPTASRLAGSKRRVAEPLDRLCMASRQLADAMHCLAGNPGGVTTASGPLPVAPGAGTGAQSQQVARKNSRDVTGILRATLGPVYWRAGKVSCRAARWRTPNGKLRWPDGKERREKRGKEPSCAPGPSVGGLESNLTRMGATLVLLLMSYPRTVFWPLRHPSEKTRKRQASVTTDARLTLNHLNPLFKKPSNL